MIEPDDDASPPVLDNKKFYEHDPLGSGHSSRRPSSSVPRPPRRKCFASSGETASSRLASKISKRSSSSRSDGARPEASSSSAAQSPRVGIPIAARRAWRPPVRV